MQRRPHFVFLTPRFPWWAWVFLLPLALVAIFLGAFFLLVFLSLAIGAALILWIRWKWSTRGMSCRRGKGEVRREYHVARTYDYELKRLDDPRDGEK